MMFVDVFSKVVKVNLGSFSVMYLIIVVVFWLDLDSLIFFGLEG